MISDSGFFTFKTRRFRLSDCHVQDFQGLRLRFFDRLGIRKDIAILDMSGIYSHNAQVSGIDLDDFREIDDGEQHRGSIV